VLTGLASPAQAEERYYLCVFAYQPKVPQARYSHTFATFIKVDHQGGDPCDDPICEQTISWLPATGEVRTWALRPEKGRNFSLKSTLRMGMNVGSELYMWGPFEITQASYCRLARRKRELESGRILYRAVDGFYRETDISNCIHAVSDADPTRQRARYPVLLYGYIASRNIVRVMHNEGSIKSGGHYWLIPRLGLDRYPIEVYSYAPRPARDNYVEVGMTCQFRNCCDSSEEPGIEVIEERIVPSETDAPPSPDADTAGHVSLTGGAGQDADVEPEISQASAESTLSTEGDEPASDS
jgi:hypothetical protein